MREVCVQFGALGHLAGTLVMPEATHEGCVAAVFLNAGLIPRMGPRRFNVNLSRALAARGAPGIRFDLSGRGDSLAGPRTNAGSQRPVDDLIASIDFLESTLGIRKVALFGICSGAGQALDAASRDQRIVALWLADPPSYPTWRTYWNRHADEIKRHPLATIARVISRRMLQARSLALRVGGGVGPRMSDIDYGNHRPSAARFAETLNRLAARGAHVYITYTASQLRNFNYDEQLRDAFSGEPFLAAVKCELRRDINHIFTCHAMQESMTSRLLQWWDSWQAPERQHKD